MTRVFLDGFASELLKLASDDSEGVADHQDPNQPWRADTEARGIRDTARLPSRVPTGHLGAVGAVSKHDSPDMAALRGKEQTGDY